jgi:tetratricopeptide (TPR) repeat protein
VIEKCLLSLVLIALFMPPAFTDATADPEIAKGIAQVDDGDYDGAILTLDNAARRLAPDPTRSADLSQAYLYMGIAYIGKGHEAAAKAKFREAIAQIRSLSLSPDKFPPKVIDIFEAAKEEENRSAPTAASPAPTSGPTPTAEPKKGGGGGKVLLILGGVAAAGGIAVAAGGGGGGGGGSSAPTTTTTTVPPDTRVTDHHTGSICGYSSPGRQQGTCHYVKSFDVVVSQPGTLDATVTWTDASVFFDMILYDQAGKQVAPSSRTGNTTSQLTAAVTPQTGCSSCAYQIQVERSDSKGSMTFDLVVKHP